MKTKFALFTDITVEESATVSGGGHAPKQPEPSHNPPRVSQPPFVILFPGILTQIIGS